MTYSSPSGGRQTQTSLGIELLRHGLATLHGSYDPNRHANGADLVTAQDAAKHKRLGVWVDWSPEKEAAEKEKKEKASADKAAKESARERVAKSKSTDTLDDAPALGGALGLGFLGINNSSSSLASQGESTKEGEKKDEGGTQAAKGMSVKDLAAALMAELRGLEDRVEVLGEEEGAMVALKLGAALEAVRQEPFKSI